MNPLYSTGLGLVFDDPELGPLFSSKPVVPAAPGVDRVQAAHRVQLRRLGMMLDAAEATGLRYTTERGRIKWVIHPVEYIQLVNSLLSSEEDWVRAAALSVVEGGTDPYVPVTRYASVEPDSLSSSELAAPEPDPRAEAEVWE